MGICSSPKWSEVRYILLLSIPQFCRDRVGLSTGGDQVLDVHHCLNCVCPVFHGQSRLYHCCPHSIEDCTHTSFCCTILLVHVGCCILKDKSVSFSVFLPRSIMPLSAHVEPYLSQFLACLALCFLVVSLKDI